jgi:hypothetical protein
MTTSNARPLTDPTRTAPAPSETGLKLVAATCRALSHPTRVRVLIEFALGQHSPAGVMRRLADPALSLPSVAYHVRELVAADLIELAFTTPRRGAIEHSYGLTARGRAAIGVVTTLADA